MFIREKEHDGDEASGAGHNVARMSLKEWVCQHDGGVSECGEVKDSNKGCGTM